ncbi:MAG: hypothetical protein MJ252_20240 [archaeon]|nr:hypothetical protein [archaeon]
MRPEAVEYYKHNSPKKEINHRAQIAPKDHSFYNNCFGSKNSPHREPKRKLLEKEVIGSSMCVERPTWRRQFPEVEKRNGNITYHESNFTQNKPETFRNGYLRQRVKLLKFNKNLEIYLYSSGKERFVE